MPRGANPNSRTNNTKTDVEYATLRQCLCVVKFLFFFFQAEDGIRDLTVTGVQTCALPISFRSRAGEAKTRRFRLEHPAQRQTDGRMDPVLSEFRRAGRHHQCAARRLPEIGRASCRERV